MLWCEAGQGHEQFLYATPRAVMGEIRAYLRRRSWLAWNIAALSRAQKFPAFSDFSGEARYKPKMSEAVIAHNASLWISVISQMKPVEV